MTALIVIGSIILIIALLLSFSLTVYVRITDEVQIKIGAFGYKHKLKLEEKGKTPKAKKVKKDKSKHKKTDKETLKKKKVTEKTFGETVELVLSLIKSALKPLGNLLTHIRITNLSLYMTICGEHADETALSYGQLSAAIYNLLGHLDNLITLKIKTIDIVPDFVSDEAIYNIYFKVKIRFAVIIGAGLRILYRFVANILKNKNG